MEGGKKFLTFLLVAVLALGFGFGGGMLANGYTFSKTAQTSNNTNAATNTISGVVDANKNTAENTGVAQPTTQPVVINVSDGATVGEAIAEKVLPSVVGIDVIYETSYNSSWYFGFGRGGNIEAEAQGTGFVVDAAGYILTNSHVVNDGDYKKVTVSLYDGREVEGKVLWNDSTLDLAIVKIEATGLVAAELGDSDTLRIGQYAAALGNPLGLQFKFSMSQGIISGLERTITVSSDGTSTGATTMEGLIQTDAAINSGNSGGPLLNSKGQVIAINSAKAADGESMGFAIPINVAKPIIEQIKATGSFTRAYIGIKGIGLEETGYDEQTLKQHYGTGRGIYVSEVSPGGGAEAAGLQKDDIILSVNGTEVGTMNKINSIIVGYMDGDTVSVTYLRGGQEYTVDVRLSTK